MSKHLRDYCWLVRGEAYSLRLQWFWFLIMMALGPMMLMLMLYLFGGRGDPARVVFVVTGSLAQSLTSSSMLSLGQTIGSLKDQHAYEHYATLPVAKLSLVLAMATRGMMLSLPSFTIILIISRLAFGVSLPVSPATVGVFILASLSLAGMGAFIGFYSTTGQVASMATQVLAGAMTFLAPVYVSREQLPLFLQRTAWFIPSTHVATALRALAPGVAAEQMPHSLLWLGAFTAASLYLVHRKLDWRAGQG